MLRRRACRCLVRATRLGAVREAKRRDARLRRTVRQNRGELYVTHLAARRHATLGKPRADRRAADLAADRPAGGITARVHETYRIHVDRRHLVLGPHLADRLASALGLVCEHKQLQRRLCASRAAHVRDRHGVDKERRERRTESVHESTHRRGAPRVRLEVLTVLLPHEERLARDAHNEPLLRTQRRHAQEQLVPDVEVVKRTPEGHGASHGPGPVQRPGRVRRCRGIRPCVVSREQRALGAAQQLQDIVWHAEASVVHGIDSRPLQTSSRPSLCSSDASLRGGRRGYKPDVDIAEQRILLHSDGPRRRVHVLQELLHVVQRDVRG